MRLLLMAGNYSPEKTASAPLTTDFCNYMLEAGHGVRVVTTFPHYPQWRVWEGYSGIYRREDVNGITARRIRHYIPPRPTPIKRILYYGSFGVTAFVPGIMSGRPDLILCVTPPLELAISARILSLIWNVPYVLWIKDLVPDVAIQLGMLRSPMAIKLARTLERFAYDRSSGLVVICESFRDTLLRHGVASEKIAVVPDWVDVEAIRPGPRHNAFRIENDIDSKKFLVTHSGNIGDKQKLELLLQAAKHLEHVTDIQFLIVGDGARKTAVVAEAERLRLSNVRFLPLQPRERLADMLAGSDALILHQQRGVADSVIPSKLLTYMASGRPVIATADAASESAWAVNRAQCGIVVEPENTAHLAQAILQLQQNPNLAQRFGRAGRRYACDTFSREVVLRRIESVLVGLQQGGAAEGCEGDRSVAAVLPK